MLVNCDSDLGLASSVIFRCFVFSFLYFYFLKWEEKYFGRRFTSLRSYSIQGRDIGCVWN